MGVFEFLKSLKSKNQVLSCDGAVSGSGGLTKSIKINKNVKIGDCAADF